MTQVPKAALGVAVSAVLMRKGYRNRSSEREVEAIANDIRAAYPHLLAAFKEALLGDEALAKMLDLLGDRGWHASVAKAETGDMAAVVAAAKLALREALQAALSTLEDTDGGTG